MVLGKILFQISCKIHNQSESQNFSEHFIQKISALINNYTTMVHHVRGVDHTSPLDLLNTTTSDQTDEIFKATCT